ncbi:MAG: hypothetical protein LBT65_06245 [Synergistaceae bacterium]|jgi:hypothetical protein|nr:hypothetical protein [Synergistaceae bacterium]
MIESFIEGRVRLRSPLLADAALAEYLTSRLREIGGVRKVEANPRTNGLLLEYDRTRLPLPVLMRAAPLFSRMEDLEKLPPDKRLSALTGLMNALVGELRNEE